jgi:hypothetical protein
MVATRPGGHAVDGQGKFSTFKLNNNETDIFFDGAGGFGCG